ncbi:MAG: STAS domain-containing protein [Thermoguttaceae bacterium]|jgi:anti-anti-sigma factor
MRDHQQLSIEEVRGITVIRFRQRRLSGILEMERLERELQQLVEAENRVRLLFDLASVEFLSSQVFGMLVSLGEKVKARGGAVKLCRLQPHVLEVLLTCKLDRIFDIQPDLAEAVRA